MAYAEYADVILRYPETADQSQARVEALLEDATALIGKNMADAGVDIDPDDAVQAVNLKSVTCAVVARALAPGNGMFGVTSLTQMAGPIQQSTSYANPTGDLYLTSGEKNRLGISTARGVQLFYGSDLLGGE